MPEAQTRKSQSPERSQTSRWAAKFKIRLEKGEATLSEGKVSTKRSREEADDAVDDERRVRKRTKYSVSQQLLGVASVSTLGAASIATSTSSEAESEAFKTPSRPSPSTSKWFKSSSPKEIHESPTDILESPETPVSHDKRKFKSLSKDLKDSIRHGSLKLLRHTKSESDIGDSPHLGPKVGEKRKREDTSEDSPSVRSKKWLKSRTESAMKLFEHKKKKSAVDGDDSPAKEDSGSGHTEESKGEGSSDCSPPPAKRSRRLAAKESFSNLRETLKIKLSHEFGEGAEIKFSIPQYIRRISSHDREKSDHVEAPKWLKSIHRRPSRRRSIDPATAKYEAVYLVLRPINFDKSAHKMIRKIGEWTDRAELRNFLLFQHWGIQVGEHFYHLHIVDEPKDDGKGMRQRIAVSLCPFEEITLKVPIWRTKKSHEDRVRDAISLIRVMGGYKSDDEVEVYGDHGEEKDVLLPEEERAKYRSTRPFKRFFPMSYRGEYHITFNNCIHFARRYLFYFIFDVVPFTSSASEFAHNLEWLAKTWLAGVAKCVDHGKRLTDMFLGLMHPMKRKTLKSGNEIIAHLAMAYLGKIDPEELTRSPVDDGPGASSPPKAIEEKAEETAEAVEAVEEGADALIDHIEDDDDDDSVSESASDSEDEEADAEPVKEKEEESSVEIESSAQPV